MPLPNFYNPANVSKIYDVDFQQAYDAGLKDSRTPASQDTPRVLLWLIDVQIDFVFPAPIGRLTVPNALEDTRRTVEFIYNNVHQISHIAASLDTHTPYQIFYPTWWVNPQGEHPQPYTVITSADVQSGAWQPTTEPSWSLQYVQALEKIGKKQLMIWPYHCMEGTLGRALVPALSEAIMYHAGARTAQPSYMVKGTLPQTEFYSAVEPEVVYPNQPESLLNSAFLEQLAQYDLIYVTGQARSHCVLETLNSTLRYFNDKHPSAISRIRFIDDATSSIVGFEQTTEATINSFEQQGMKRVKAAEPIG